MRSCVAVCAILLCFFVAACRESSSPQGDYQTPTDKVSTANGKPTKPGDKEQMAKPTILNDEKSAISAEVDVVEFLATREMLQHMFPNRIGSESTLNPYFIDWLALGVNEPLDQRLAFALVAKMEGLLNDKKFFDGVHSDSVKASLALGVIGCSNATKLQREDNDFAKALLSVGDQDLASDGRQKLIMSRASQMMDKGFNSEMAGYAAQTLAILKKDASPEMAKVHAALRQAIRETLAKHPDLTDSLRRNIKLAAEVRASHERVGKMIRAASGG